jgi:hypothetical protein
LVWQGCGKVFPATRQHSPLTPIAKGDWFQTEGNMLKSFSICATLIVLGTASVNAQQQEAILQTVELPGTGLDIVLAMPKSPAAIINLAMSPDALVINLVGGRLALPFNSENEMLKTLVSLQRPGCAFQTKTKKPVSVYVVPGHAATSVRTKSNVNHQSEPTMRKVDVPGSDFAIVFAMTKTPVITDANDRSRPLAVYSGGNELAMADAGDVEKMFKEVGLSQMPDCAFEVEHTGAASVYIIPKDETPAVAAR